MTAKDHRGECVAFIPKRHRNKGMIMIIDFNFMYVYSILLPIK